MKKRNILLILFLILVFVSFVICLVINKSVFRKDIEISTLDMSGTALPSQLVCNGQSYTASWTYEIPNQETYLNYQLLEIIPDARAFQWIGNKDEGTIYLAIADYQTPLNAKLHYILLDPVKVYSDDYENFIYRSSKMTPNDWVWNNKFANEETIQCGLGNQEKCYGWFYTARYSQYFLSIMYYGPICSNGFESIVTAINDQFVKYLE